MVKLRSLLAASLSLGLSCGVPGVPIDGDYPELTPKILNSLEQKVLEGVETDARVVQNTNNYPSDEPVISFSDAPREYINYFVDFTNEDYASQDISMKGLEGLEIAILPKNEVAGICGDLSLACNTGSTIVMPDNLNIINFFTIFNHEFGHHLYGGSAEYPAIANETYGPIKSYQFSRPIGSLMLDKGLFFPSMYSADDSSPFLKPYRKGAVFSALNLLEHYGDIEAAMEDVVYSKLLEIEIRLEKKLEEYPSWNYDDVYFELWKDVLDDTAFNFELTGNTGHLRGKESHELISYLRVLDHENYLLFYNSDDVLQQEYRNLLEKFEEAHSFNNPYFRAHVVSPLTALLYHELGLHLLNSGIVSTEVSDYSKKIIEINRGYPCYVADPYECPLFMREPNSNHLDAYYFFVQGAFAAQDTNRKNESQGYVKDFIKQFFPEADFDSGNFDAIKAAEDNLASTYLPPMAVLVGKYALAEKDYDSVEKFFRAALAANCIEGSALVPPAMCEDSKVEAERLLERLEQLRNG